MCLSPDLHHRSAVTVCESGGGLAPGAQNVPPPGHDHRLDRDKLVCKHGQDNTFLMILCQGIDSRLYKGTYDRFNLRLAIRVTTNGNTITAIIDPTR